METNTFERSRDRLIMNAVAANSGTTYRHSCRQSELAAVAAAYAAGKPIGLPAIATATGIQDNRVNVAIRFLADRGLIEPAAYRLNVATSPAIEESALCDFLSM